VTRGGKEKLHCK